MEIIENLFNVKDKTKWRRGPWDNEADKVLFDFGDGYLGLVLRGPVGSLCGYVGLPISDLRNGEAYMADCFGSIEVHGGLTYSGYINDDGVWYIGFDCSHMNDYFGMIITDDVMQRGEYRDMDYVTDQVFKLKEQLCDPDTG